MCSWCEQWWTEDFGIWRVYHKFFSPEGDGCAGSPEHTEEESTLHCVRCGGTSSCHDYEMEGFCHIECGPGGGENGNGNGNGPDQSLALNVLETMAEAGDVESLVTAIRTHGIESGGHLIYSSEGGRIEVLSSCGHPVPVARIAIPVDTRRDLDRLLATGID